MITHFDNIQEAVADEILGVSEAFKADQHPDRVDLSVGAYRDDNGKPYVLNVVKKAEKIVLENTELNHEYLTIDGDKQFIALSRALIFGADSEAVQSGRITTIQSLSGTGSLRIGYEFVSHFLPNTCIYASKPTWGNHIQIAKMCRVPCKQYRYWNASTRGLDIEGMLEDIRAAPERSVILLHACAHNPTGVDPTKEQWQQIAEVCKERHHLPFFDSAYQGFATGSLEDDTWPIRYFVSQGFEMFAAQSYAKNFGLYNERIGSFSVVCKDAATAKTMLGQLKTVARPLYSNPPAHGARVVSIILSNQELFAEWVEELKGMSGRIIKMRQVLYDALVKLNTPGTWTHITSQIGMFSFTGLTPAQVAVMVNKYHIYLIGNGRISMAGVNTKNVEYIATAIDDVVRNVHE